MNEKSSGEIPLHIKGSKARYKRFRGKKFILEEVSRPCDLKDSDYVNKELLYENIRQVARQTLTEEVAQNIPKYFNESELIYIYSDLKHRVVAISVFGCIFENGNFVMIVWLTMCVHEYRQYGLLKGSIPKMFFYFVKEYNRIMGYTGIKCLIPFFIEMGGMARAINPILYYAVLNSPMKISPPINSNGEIDVCNISEKEIKIRKSYLQKLGYAEDEINENIFIYKSVLKNDDENKITHAKMPITPNESVNKFFKDNLGLDKGNALLVFIHCRPAFAMIVFFPLRFCKTLWRMTKNIFTVSEEIKLYQKQE